MATVRSRAKGPVRADTPALQRLKQLEAITEVALAHLRLDELLDALLARLRTILRVDTAAVLLLDEETDELVARAAKGLEAEVERGVRIPVGKGFAGRVAATRKPVFLPRVTPQTVVNPILIDYGVESLLGVPLMVEGNVIGVLHVGSVVPRQFSADDSELLQLAGDRMGLAIEHARLFEAEREAREAAEAATEQIRQIQSITEPALSHLSLDDDQLLVEMLDRVVDQLNVDTAAILMLDARENELVARVARGIEEEVARGVRIPIGRGFAGRIAAERRPVIIEDLRREDVLNPILTEKGIRTLLGVPLMIEGSVVGVLHVGALRRRRFTAEDLRLLELAGDRVAVAIDRGRHHNVAALLQRSLLPVRLPEVSGLSMAARYEPAADDVHVGGDWYDVIPLGGERIGLAMGDVVSRGVRAAAIMGQMRTALRAYALEGDSPAKVMQRMDRLVYSIEDREMATVAYLLLNYATGELSYSLAGHPAPIVISADGKSTRFIEAARSHPVGVALGGEFDEADDRLERGETLLLYTDGLVERRDQPIDAGLERLAAIAAEGPRHPEQLCAQLLDEFQLGADDVAVLAVRRDDDDPGHLHLELHATATSLSRMRQALRSWLLVAGLSEDATYDVLVATSEAAANAVEHAYGPGDAVFEVSAEAGDSEVVVVVADRGRWRQPRGEHRGRGLELMEQLMDAVEVKPGDAGTVVRLIKSISAEAAA